MRLVFFGSGAFGLPTLAALAEAGHEIAAVVTQPDRPAGRGGCMRATPVKELAERLGIPVLQPERPNTAGFAEAMAGLSSDLAVIVAYGHLIKKDLLSLPRHGFVNLHASLLPAYRGAAPVPWAILSGETVSGATVFCLNERFDSGGVLATAELPIDPDDTSAAYLEKLAPVGAALMRNVVVDYVAGRLTPKAQDESRASRAPKLSKADGLIDWRQSLEVIRNKVRALQPWPLAHTCLPTAKGGVGINILKIESVRHDGVFVPGQVVLADPKHGLVIMAGDGPVRLTLFQPEGKRPMPDTEFLRGTKVAQ